MFPRIGQGQGPVDCELSECLIGHNVNLSHHLEMKIYHTSIVSSQDHGTDAEKVQQNGTQAALSQRSLYLYPCCSRRN